MNSRGEVKEEKRIRQRNLGERYRKKEGRKEGRKKERRKERKAGLKNEREKWQEVSLLEVVRAVRVVEGS